METKEQLVQIIKQWVKLDNETRVIQKELKVRKTEKQKISAALIETMRKNEIDCFDIKDGQIIYSKKNVKKPITQKSLLSILSQYFINDPVKANDVNDFILNSREEVVKEEIVRKVYSSKSILGEDDKSVSI
jgi:hypothetical protein